MADKPAAEEKTVRSAAKTLLIPKMAPLLLVQLFAYGLVLLVAMGILITKYVRPGLATFGIVLITNTDRLADHGERLVVVEGKQKVFEDRMAAIETGVRILVKEIAPDKVTSLPPPIQVADRRHD